MENLISMLHRAEQLNIDVDWFSMRRAESVSMPLPDDHFGIAIDPKRVRSAADQLVKLSHELGHCQTGSFYNRYATCDLRQKHENRADRWAIQTLIPKEELDTALTSGCTELWQLADHFGVTEPFMQKALCLYCHGNLAVSSYYDKPEAPEVASPNTV